MRTTEANVIEIGPSPELAPELAPELSPRVGALVVHEGELRIDYPGNQLGPLPARTLVAIQPGERRPALLVFEEGRPDRPIVVGLLDPLPPSAPNHSNPTHSAPTHSAPTHSGPAQDLRIDGRRLEIEGHDEVVLRCGEASITLRRNGRVLLRGVYIETRAAGVNRIKGGSVQIN